MNRTTALAAVGIVVAFVAAVLFTSVDTGAPTPPAPDGVEAPTGGRPAPSAAPTPRAVPSPAPSRSAPAERPDREAGRASVETVGDIDGSEPDDGPGSEEEPLHETSVWTLDKAGIQGAVQEAAPAMSACYEEALTRDPELAGSMSLGFTVTDQDGIGAVTMVELDEGGVTDDGMIDCVLDAFEGLQFDPPMGGGELSVTYPVIFSTENLEEG